MIGSLPGQRILGEAYLSDEEIPGDKKVVDAPEGEAARPGLLRPSGLPLTLGIVQPAAQKPVCFRVGPGVEISAEDERRPTPWVAAPIWAQESLRLAQALLAMMSQVSVDDLDGITPDPDLHPKGAADGKMVIRKTGEPFRPDQTYRVAAQDGVGVRAQILRPWRVGLKIHPKVPGDQSGLVDSLLPEKTGIDLLKGYDVRIATGDDPNDGSQISGMRTDGAGVNVIGRHRKYQANLIWGIQWPGILL